MKGLISETQKSSIHDGPGLRPVLFLKSCNMRCAWCHTPETIHDQVKTLFSPDHVLTAENTKRAASAVQK